MPWKRIRCEWSLLWNELWVCQSKTVIDRYIDAQDGLKHAGSHEAAVSHT